jgi:hypothetical protein
MTDLTVANTIREQIGHKALYMIGAKNFIGSRNSLTFRIMRNEMKVTYITVTLNGNDYYDVDFFKMKRDFSRVYISQCKDVDFTMLRNLIQTETHLYVSL